MIAKSVYTFCEMGENSISYSVDCFSKGELHDEGHEFFTFIKREREDDNMNNLLTRTLQQDMSGSRQHGSTTSLHNACKKFDSLEEIRRIFLKDPTNATIQDSDGRLPLHLLGENAGLFHMMNQPSLRATNNSNHGAGATCSGAGAISGGTMLEGLDPLNKFIVDELLPLCRNAPMTIDNFGNIPFTQKIVDWISTIHEQHIEKSEIRSSVPLIQKEEEEQQQQHNDCEVPSNRCHDDQYGDYPGESNNSLFESIIPSKVNIPSIVAWCFSIMDKILDVSPPAQIQRIVEHVAKIPSLAKMLLLISDNERRETILSTSIVQRVLISKACVGNWIVPMLMSPSRHVRQGGIDYLHIISTTDFDCWEKERTMNRYMSLIKLPSSVRSLHGEKQKWDVFQKLFQQEELILALLQLPPKQFDIAANLSVIGWILDEHVFRPGAFTLYIICFDLIFFILLLTNFKLSTGQYFSGIPLEDTRGLLLQTYTHGQFIMTSFCYFTLRQLHFFRNIPVKTIMSHFALWSANDIISITLAATLQNIYFHRVKNFPLRDKDDTMYEYTEQTAYDKSATLRALSAITIGLLWLKALSYLKILNRYLATFVLAFVEITRDISWFFLVFVIIIVASSEMFYIALYQPIQTECAMKVNNSNETGEVADEDANPFCFFDKKKHYLYIYNIILGDFTISDFYTPFSVILFFIYTFVVVIIILNVLIAIVGDTYGKSQLYSSRLFAQARLLFVAEIIALRQSARKEWMLRSSIVIMVLSGLLCVNVVMDETTEFRGSVTILTAAVCYGLMFILLRKFLQRCPSQCRLPFVILLALWSAIILWMIISYKMVSVYELFIVLGISIAVFETLVSVLLNSIQNYFGSYLRSLCSIADGSLLCILGLFLSKSSKSSPFIDDDNGQEGGEDSEWSGTATYIESKVSRTIGHTENRLKASLHHAEQQIKTLEKKLDSLLEVSLQTQKKQTSPDAGNCGHGESHSPESTAARGSRTVYRDFNDDRVLLPPLPHLYPGSNDDV